MKKWMKMTATMMAAAMALTACGGNDAADDSADAGETYTVGIIQQLEHPALDQATKGFEDKLTAESAEIPLSRRQRQALMCALRERLFSEPQIPQKQLSFLNHSDKF